MMFEDNTLITLGRKSEMKITKYSWKPGNKDSEMETSVREGDRSGRCAADLRCGAGSTDLPG